MKTLTFHTGIFGSFGSQIPTDNDGWTIIHDSPRYGKATDEQLARWRQSHLAAVRSAASAEAARRAVSAWHRQSN